MIFLSVLIFHSHVISLAYISVLLSFSVLLWRCKVDIVTGKSNEVDQEASKDDAQFVLLLKEPSRKHPSTTIHSSLTADLALPARRSAVLIHLCLGCSLRECWCALGIIYLWVSTTLVIARDVSCPRITKVKVGSLTSTCYWVAAWATRWSVRLEIHVNIDGLCLQLGSNWIVVSKGAIDTLAFGTHTNLKFVIIEMNLVVVVVLNR